MNDKTTPESGAMDTVNGVPVARRILLRGIQRVVANRTLAGIQSTAHVSDTDSREIRGGNRLRRLTTDSHRRMQDRDARRLRRRVRGLLTPVGTARGRDGA